MASLRTHTRIARSADDVWNAVSDAGGISRGSPVQRSQARTGGPGLGGHERVRGIKLDCVASDILGKSGRAMLDALVAGTTDPEVLADLAQGKLRAKIPALKQALEGRFEAHHALVIGAILTHPGLHRWADPAPRRSDRDAASHWPAAFPASQGARPRSWSLRSAPT